MIDLRSSRLRRGRARGLTLLEIMISMAVPSFHRTIEQVKADVAVANLRAVWSAQRFYWMDNRGYAASLSQLRDLDLVDSALTSGDGPYSYSVSTTSGGFSASATRSGTSRWSGGFSIDQSGQITGAVRALSEADIVAAPQ